MARDPVAGTGRHGRVRRWLPAVVAPALVIGSALAFPAMAGAAVDLPDLTPQQVLALAAASEVSAFSGSVEQRSDLGLPSLPMAGASGTEGAGAALELLAAPHDARVFVSGESLRVQVLDTAAERNIVATPAGVWLYDSSQDTATFLEPGAGSPAHPEPPNTMTPQQFADQAIAAIDADTAVTVGRDRRVAGRSAYELILRPDSATTLIGSVAIAVDAQTGMPLAVEVVARGQADPAWSVAFTSLDLSAPDPAVFQFTPPEGAEVQRVAAPQFPASSHPMQKSDGELEVVGSGWDAVVTAQLPADALVAAAPSAGGTDLLAALTSPVPGGRVVTTALLSVLITDSGQVLAGAVPAQRLVEVAGAR